MSGKNIFDLDKKFETIVSEKIAGGAGKKVAVHEDNPEDYEKILKAYVEIPRSSWSSIPINTYIRYITKDGVLKTGSRIKSIDNDNELVFTCAKFQRGRKPMIWSVSANKIDKIYKYREDRQEEKSEPQTKTLTDQIVSSHPPREALLSQLGEKLLSEDTGGIKDKVESHDVRLQKIEKDISKILNMVKRLSDMMQS